MTNLKPAPELAERAQPIIHEHHFDLASEEILWYWREKPAKSKGRLVLGRARLISGASAFAARARAGDVSSQWAEPEPFFAIEIAWPTWLVLEEDERDALLDHELSHCRVELTEAGEVARVIRGHDVEEFVSVIGRRGLWKPELRALGDAIERPLPLRLA